MIKPEQIEQFKTLLANTETVIIAYAEEASVDELAAAVGLAEGMALLDKSIRLASPKVANNPDINGLNKTVTELGHENLVVSFDYSQEAVHNVSYHISEDSKKFFLTIKPQKGKAPLDTSTLKSEYTGTHADMILVVGVEDYEELKQIYYGYEDVYRDATVIPFATYPSYKSRFSFASMGRSSLSEVVGDLLHQLEVKYTKNLATNLLRGIEWSTDQLQSESTTADTYEVIAHLLRAGAIRSEKNAASSQEHTTTEVETAVSPLSVTPQPVKGTTTSLREALQKSALRKTQPLAPEAPITNGQPQQNQTQPDHPQPQKKKRRRRRKKKQHKNQPGSLNYKPSGHSVSGA